MKTLAWSRLLYGAVLAQASLVGCDAAEDNPLNAVGTASSGGTSAVMSAGGSGVSGAGGASGVSVVSCDAWRREPVPGTQSVLINNVWNEQWADGQPHTQCLLRRATEQGDQYGWKWAWPAYKPYSSYASPEALVGWKPWDGGASTSPDLPKRLDALESLTIDFAVDIAADPTYNLNASMWITTSDVASATRTPDDIRNEVMVWFANPADLGGGITYDGEVTLAGITFDVWHLVNQPDASGTTTHTWTMVIYTSRTPYFEASFDLKLVLDDCIAKGLVDPTHAVGGVELITEVFGGSGELWLKRFGVTAKAR